MPDPQPKLEPLPLDEAHRRRGLIFVGLACALAGCALAIQMGVNANFLREEIGVNGGQMGYLEAVRESCGITAFAVLALLAGLGEPLVAAAMLVVFAVGLGSYAFAKEFAHPYLVVMGLSLLWSQGLHVWMPLPNSMTLALAEPGRAGHRLGQISSASAVGMFLGLAAALALSWLHVPMRLLYLLAGAAALAAAGACLGIPRQIRTPGPKLVLRRRYGLYYLLCFLEGWRKQVFICFAPFLLVAEYHAPLWHMLILAGIANGIGYFAAPRVGRMIDRVGERRVIIFYYACLIWVFVGYAFSKELTSFQSLIPPRLLLYGLFVLDSAFFVFNTAPTVYVNRIAPPGERTATLSAGVAFNHVAAVSMPFLGGLAWVALGYRWTFLIGSVAGILSILAATKVPRHVVKAG